MKIIIGAGSTEQAGWISFNQNELDITNENAWVQLFQLASLDAIVAEHVWEHLTIEQGRKAAALCFRYLKPGGNLRIAVPDGFHAHRTYIEWVKPGTGFNGDDHKVLYDFHSLSNLLLSVGFKVRLKEFFDEQGKLHSSRIDDERGHIRRGAQTAYSRLLGWWIGTRYTSLIVDAVKAT